MNLLNFNKNNYNVRKSLPFCFGGIPKQVVSVLKSPGLNSEMRKSMSSIKRTESHRNLDINEKAHRRKASAMNIAILMQNFHKIYEELKTKLKNVKSLKSQNFNGLKIEKIL